MLLKIIKLEKKKTYGLKNEEGSKITYYKAFDEKDESNYVVNEIKEINGKRS